MLEGVGKTIGEFIEERLSSPLLGTFIISWCLWNYRFLVVLLSGASVTKTFQLIDTTVFPDKYALLLHGFVLPLTTTLLYIYAYPYPAKIVFAAWRKTQYDLTKIRQQYDDQTLLSIEESRELRTQIEGLKADLEKANADLQAAKADVEAYQRKIVEMERGEVEYRQDVEKRLNDATVAATNATQAAAVRADNVKQLMQERDHARRALSGAEARLQSVEAAFQKEQASRAEMAQHLQRLTNKKSSSEELPGAQRVFLVQLADAFGDYVSWSDLNSRYAGKEKVSANYLIQDLVERDLLKRVTDRDGEEQGFEFTQTGRKIVFEEGKTS